MNDLLRVIKSSSLKDYNLELNSYIPLSNNSFKIITNNNTLYFLKQTSNMCKSKYQFLHNEGVSNVIYPLENNRNEYTSKSNSLEYYITPFIDDTYVKNEIKAKDLLEELIILHEKTSFTRRLSVSKSRKKMEEIFDYLNYKFNTIESFVRTVEATKFNEYSITILKNYNVILDLKNEMIKRNKKIIQGIKEEKSVVYCFLHNNPKLDHLIIHNGNKYLISIDNAKFGILSLDIAKYYVENEDIDFDIGNRIMDYFKKFDDDFYFDYFVFLVLYIYIMGLSINGLDYVTSQSFLFVSSSTKKFFKTFNITMD